MDFFAQGVMSDGTGKDREWGQTCERTLGGAGIYLSALEVSLCGQSMFFYWT